MSRSPLQDSVERIQRLADAAGQIIEVARDSGSGTARNLWEEVVEAAADMRGLLAGPDWRTPAEELDRREQVLLSNKNLNQYGVDPFGFSPEYVRGILRVVEFIHRIYFRSEVFDIDRVPATGRCLLIANHSGQLPLDGVVIGTSLLLDRDPPRMIRSMVEKFATRLPWFGTFCMRCGQVTGLPDNCRRLLENEESVLVFPEGARGISKPFSQRYQMAQFGQGFMRLALETGTPIVPIGVVGGEEQIINLGNFELLARLLNAPSFPLPPLALLVGPLAMCPMPVKYRLYFGEPMRFEGDANDDDAVIAGKVNEVRGAIDRLLQRGLRERKGIFI